MRWAFPLLLLAATGCAASPVESLADRPTLPFRVLVAGGAFVQRTEFVGNSLPESDREILASTTFEPDEDEAASLDDIVRDLARGGVFAGVLASRALDDDARRLLAAQAVAADTLDVVPSFEALRKEAEEQSADLLLVLEGVRDQPITTTGVNGQWPVTCVAWISVGLGMFIPDHSFASQASLSATLREPVQGKVLATLTASGSRVDLSLVQRTDFLGLISSVIVPPPLIGNDDLKVAARIREDVRRAMVSELVRKLKSRETLDLVQRRIPLRILISSSPPGAFQLEIQSEQDLAQVRILVDGKHADGPEWRRFVNEFLRSGRSSGGASQRFYKARSPALGGDRPVEVRALARTVRGERGSQTVRLTPER